MSFNAEFALIGSMLIDESCLAAMLEKMSAEDFESLKCSDTFSAMADLSGRGVPVDPVTLSNELGGSSADFLLECMEITPTAANADAYAEIIKRNRFAREVQGVASGLAMAEDLGEVAKAIRELSEIADRGNAHDVIGGTNWASQFAEEQARIIADPESAFCKTGYSGLDSVLGGGMFNGGLYVLGARPGMGKTTFAINVAEKVSGCGRPVLFVSLEMSARQIMCKRIAIEGLIPYRELMSGKMSMESQREMRRCLERIQNRPFYTNERFGLTVNDIATLARRVNGCKLIVVDYFGLISVDGGARERYEDYTAISGQLKQLACQLNLPILCLAQLNRENNKRKDKRPTLTDLRDTGAIEQDADAVLFLNRGSYYDSGTKPESEPIEVIVAKNRHGETGTVEMMWNGTLGAIAQYETRYEETGESEIGRSEPPF